MLASLHEVDAQDDINRVLAHFSYEHFYVIYCKFWDLDTGAVRGVGAVRCGGWVRGGVGVGAGL